MKNKPGFSDFMCKLEGKEPLSVYDFWYSGDRCSVFVNTCKRFLEERNPSFLTSCFTWRFSPQGHDYWKSRNYSVEKLTPKDIKYVEWLVRTYSQ